MLSPPFRLAVLCFIAACHIDGHYDPIDATPDAADAGDVPIAEWSTRYGGPGNDGGNAIAVAPNGDLVITGAFSNTMTLGGAPLSSAGGLDAWVARYKADGTFVWSTRFGGIGADRGGGIAIDNNGDVYVIGDFEGPVNFGGGARSGTGGFLLKLASDTGAYVWDRVVDASGSESVSSVTIVDTNSIAIGGVFAGAVNLGGGSLGSTPANSPDGFVAVYEISAGSHVWSRVLTSTGQNDELGGLASVNGDVLVAGAFTGTGTFGGNPLTAQGFDFFVARYRGSDGAHAWSMHQGGSSNEAPRAIAVSGSRFFVGGFFFGTTNLGGADIQARSAADAFVAMYEASDGRHVWSRAFGSSLYDDVTSLTASPTRLAVGVAFEDDIAIGSQTFTLGQNNSRDIAIVRLDISSGEPRVASQFGYGSSSFQDRMVLAYAPDRLAGVGTFSMSTKLFGVDLRSDGGLDIALFRVDF